MKRTFTKGELKKEIIYADITDRLGAAHRHVVSMHGSDKTGHVRLENERYEEFGIGHLARRMFWKWAVELGEDGWECVENSTAGIRSRATALEGDKEGRIPHKPRVGEDDHPWRRGKYYHRIVICPICGQKYETKALNQKYCSKECYKRSRLAVHETKKCEWCKNEFMPTKSSQKYCSKKCCDDAHNRSRQEKIKQERGEMICQRLQLLSSE